MTKSKNVLIFSIIFFGVFSLAQNSWAKDLYVAIDGNDATSRAINDISHPWRTPQMAWNNAQAGDVVYFRGGTYVMTSSSAINTYAAGNNGTASAPITFQNYQDEVVYINSDGSIYDTMFEICKNYNVVKGFIINANGAAHIFRVGYEATVEGFTITDCNLYGFPDGDNRTALYLGSSGASCTLSNVLVQRCKITGPPLVPNQRGGCIIVFNVDNIRILNNEIKQADIGIYYKHANDVTDTGIEFGYNYIYGSHIGISNTGNYINIHDNIIGGPGCTSGIHIGEAAGYCGGDYNIINHNTLYNNLMDLYYDCQAEIPSLCGSQYNTVTNNIFMIKTEYHRYSDVAHHTISDYNLFNTGNMMLENRIDYSLTQWRAHSGSDLHSISASPIFAGGASPSAIAGFALANESAGNNAGDDSKDMGADVSLVGIQDGQPPVDTTPPSPPSGLNVN